jgi:Reverse transcriptase (RNA-dependent DNA polymerase)
MKVLPTVWAMRRKRRLATGEIYKWKARLNVDGSKQEHGVNYWDTYAPVAAWATIRSIMMLAAQKGWKTKQLDFVQAYPEAPVETELYVEAPIGCKIGENKEYVLKLNNNIYGQKQAGKVWNDFLIEGLTNKLGFTQSKNDPSLLWKDGYVIIIYTDDTIITGPEEAKIDQNIKEISHVFKITHADKVSDFLGVKIDRDDNTGTVTMTQPLLIKSILKDL